MGRVKRLFLPSFLSFFLLSPSSVFACDTSSAAAWCANYYANSWNGWTSCTFTEVPSGSCTYVTARLERNGSYWGTSYFTAGTAASSALITAMASGQAAYTNGVVTYNNGATFTPATLAFTPPPPPTADQSATAMAVSGILRDASGAQVGTIPPADLAPLTSGSATGMSCSVISSGDTACAYTAPSGNSYLSVVAANGGPPSATGQAALETMLHNHRAQGENIWSVPDLQALAETRSLAGKGQKVDVDTTTGYVTGISQNTTGTTTVDITLFSSPVPNIPDTSAAPISSDMAARIASGGGGSNTPSPPSTVGSTTSTAPAPALGGTSPAVNYVEQAMSNISAQSNIASEAPAIVYQFFGGGAGGSAGSPTVIKAVNTATGQQVGSVTVDGTPLTAAQVAEAVALGVQRGLAAQVGGIGANSGNVSQNPTATGGSLPAGDAVRAGTGSGSSALIGSSPFYHSIYPAGTTIGSLYQVHFNNISNSSFITGLRSLVPSFGGATAPRWCFSPSRYGTHCVDFSQYAYVFTFFKSLLLILAAFRCYFIVLGRG